MQSKMWSAAAVALAASSLVSAQTFTACNPTKQDCPADPALAGTVTLDLTQGPPKDHIEALAGTTLTYDANKGAVFTIKSVTDAPTVASHKYIFFGRVDVVMQAAPGAGIVTSVVLQSDDLDEIDVEFVGGDAARMQSNYFSRGDTSTYDRGEWHPVSRPMAQEHTYSMEWTKDFVKWSIDGTVVRTLTYQAAKGGSTFPQTPMQIKFGTWVAGKAGASKGTIDWSGGITDFSKGPFVATYKSIKITDYMGGSQPGGGVQGAKQYVYGDRSGTYKSIRIETGSGAAAQAAPEDQAAPVAPAESAAPAVASQGVGPATTIRGATSGPAFQAPQASEPQTPEPSIDVESTPTADAEDEPFLLTAEPGLSTAAPTLAGVSLGSTNGTGVRAAAAPTMTSSVTRPDTTGRATPSSRVLVAAAGHLGASAGSVAVAGVVALVASLLL